MEILRQYQADIMLILSGMCGIISVFVYMTDSMSKKRKGILMQLELCAMFLLISDRRAYIFRGDTSTLGWWMVRISNFLVFFLTLAVIYSFNLYLMDLYTHEGRLEAVPRRLKVAKALILAGMALVIVSQFTGLYYTFDEFNRYQRAPGYLICYAIPLSVLLTQSSVILQYRKNLSRNMRLSLHGNQLSHAEPAHSASDLALPFYNCFFIKGRQGRRRGLPRIPSAAAGWRKMGI